MTHVKVGCEKGWKGSFTRETADGAMSARTRVVKINSVPGDTHADGTPGVILGSIVHPEIMDGAICYFVEWAAKPRVAVAVMAFKLRKAAE